MSDMIGLLRFGIPVSPAPAAPLVDAQAHKAAPEISAVAASSGGGQAAANYTATPRPAISPQFAYASAGEAVSDSGAGSRLALPEPFDINVLTGPPPTFEATLLELEAHLRMSLARIDASRNVHAMDRPMPVDTPKPGAAKPEASAATGHTTGPAGAAKPEASAAAGHMAGPAGAGDTKPAPQPMPQPMPQIGRAPAPGGLRETGGSDPDANGNAATGDPAADAARKDSAEPAAA